MTNDKSSEVTTEASEQADESRRGLMALALGLFGAGALSACSSPETPDRPDLERGRTALTGSNFVWFDSIAPTSAAHLVSTNGTTPNQIAVVEGYTNAGDGGGGLFWWESGVTSGHDDGTVIVPSSAAGGATGRWRRVFAGALNVKWFGALGNEANIESARFTSALAAAVATKASAIYIPAGTYLVTDLAVTSAIKLVGDGRGLSILKQPNGSSGDAGSASANPIVRATASLAVEGLTFDGNQANQTASQRTDCIKFDGTNAELSVIACGFRNTTATGIHAVNVRRGLHVTSCEFIDPSPKTGGSYPASSTCIFVESGTASYGTNPQVNTGSIAIVENRFVQSKPVTSGLIGDQFQRDQRGPGDHPLIAM